MAKVTIEIDTHDTDDIDIAILAALNPGGHEVLPQAPHQEAEPATYGTEAPYEDEQTVDPTPAAEAPKRTRRTKAQIEADNAAAQATPADGSAGSAASGPTATETAPPAETASMPASDVTLAMINDRLRDILGRDNGTGVKCMEIVKRITNGQSTSPKHCDPQFWPAIYNALEAL